MATVNFESVVKVRETIREMLFDFLKHIVTLSAALLALLISLNQQVSGNILIFHCLLLSLLLSILSGVASLYIVLSQFRRMDKDLLESIRQQIRDGEKSHQPVFSKYNKLLKVCEVFCVLCFSMSMILLLAFSFT